ncbi:MULTISPECIES: sensor histidine kinase [Desulfococcus]|nr:PAS domain-containing sensor histidine kinase [Desulfococcus multivorans]AOY58773.1 two component system sensor histidine kinase [Desulfococcus multivorans]
MMRTLFEKWKPAFWNLPVHTQGPFKHMFNFRRIWKLTVALTAGVTLLPLIAITLIDYNVTQSSIESEILLTTARSVSNTKRSISFFLDERKSALDFLVHNNTFESLMDESNLARILRDLQKGFGGGFEDMGVIDAAGLQRAYVGPYNLKGKDYSDQSWFRKVVESGIYISDVFLGFRNVPHLVIAVKYDLPDGDFYILRSSLDTYRFILLLSELELSGRGDAFMINDHGILQTPSRYHGKVLEPFSLPVPAYSDRTEVHEIQDVKGEPIIFGYAYIPNTPFILVIVKLKRAMMKSWHQTRLQLIGFLVASITIILLVILGVATYLVNNLYVTDQKRLMSLHQLEYGSKMASIGRLAAGIAHEINNPLAIINEKAGLIKDLFCYKKEYADDPRLIRTIDAIIASVERCGTITKRLLGFSRQSDVMLQKIDVGELLREVLSFTGKEAEYRSIDVTVAVQDAVPLIESDRGKLQQIFLNLINNSFAAMEDGGHLEISAVLNAAREVVVSVKDDGCGISEADLRRVFEPFFSTKTQKGGTGLGLSITYNLVKEIGGQIDVESEEGVGTCFIVRLPVDAQPKKENPK